MPSYRFDTFTIDGSAQLLLDGGGPVALGDRAARLLLALLGAPEHRLSKAQLLDAVWPDAEVEEHNVSQQVSALRRVLGADAIATVPGFGYRFTRAVTEVDAEPTAAPAASATGTLHLGALELRGEQRLALLDGQVLDIGSRAFDVLSVLVEERQRVVSKRELLARVWSGLVVEENNLQVQVSTLRRVLGQHAITTVPGRGYRFTLAAHEEQPLAAPAPPDLPVLQPTPPPSPSSARRSNLPSAAEALIGRAAELEALRPLLAQQRLVTILGAGGIGKTRLGQALARDLLGEFAGGVWWIDLAALTEEHQVAPAIAAAIGEQLGDGDAAAQLAQAIAARPPTLLVLDNCEHLAPAVAKLASALISGTLELKLLATSQVPLHNPGETVYRLEPLAVPPAGTELAAARSYGALLLLERRAQAVQGSFAIQAETLPLAIEICRELDGLPLAIEMAASRLPWLGLRNLLEALRQKLRWLRSDGRHTLARQQTLRAALDWSHGLLSERAQVVLRRLAVFAGSFALDAARSIAAFGELDEWAVVEALAELADCSVLQVSAQEPPTYRLLDSTRSYAAERLEQSGEAAEARKAHMQWMAELGVQTEASYWTTPDEPWLASSTPWYEDFDLAFQHACSLGDAHAAAATLGALFHIDELREINSMLEARLVAAVRLLPTAAPDDAAHIAWCCASPFARLHRVPGASKDELAKLATRAWAAGGDPRRHFQGLIVQAVQAVRVGDPAEAAQAQAHASALWSPSWPPRLGWVAAVCAESVDTIRGDAAQLLQHCRIERDFAERAGSPFGAANAGFNLADALLLAGRAREAVEAGEQVVALARASGRTLRMGLSMLNLTAAKIVAGDLDGARTTAAEMVALAWNLYSGVVLDHLALLAARTGGHAESMAMIGKANRWYPERYGSREGNEQAAVTEALKLNEAALGATVCAKLRAEGAELDDAAARRLADALVAPDPTAQRRAI